MNRVESHLQFVSDLSHQTAPGPPGAGADVGVLALAGVYQRLLPHHPRAGRPQGGAGARDGRQGTHAPHTGLRLLEWIIIRDNL